MMPKIINIFLFCLLISGCGGDDSAGDVKNSEEELTVELQAYNIFMPSNDNITSVDFKPYVNGKFVKVISIEPEEPNQCSALITHSLMANVSVKNDEQCRFNYTVEDGYSNQKSASLIVVKSNGGQFLLPTATVETTPNKSIVIDLAKEVELPLDYNIIDVSFVEEVGDNIESLTIEGKNTLSFTTPPLSGYGYIRYMVNNKIAKDSLVGLIYVSYSDNDLNKPQINPLKYKYKYNVDKYEEVDFDLSKLDGLEIISNGSDANWTIENVMSVGGVVTKTGDKSFKFKSATDGIHYADYLVVNSEGQRVLGTIEVHVGIITSGKWNDISLDEYIYHKPLIASDIPDKYLNSMFKEQAEKVGGNIVDLAKVTKEGMLNASNFCAEKYYVGTYPATKADLTRLASSQQNNVVEEKRLWPSSLYASVEGLTDINIGVSENWVDSSLGNLSCVTKKLNVWNDIIIGSYRYHKPITYAEVVKQNAGYSSIFVEGDDELTQGGVVNLAKMTKDNYFKYDNFACQNLYKSSNPATREQMITLFENSDIQSQREMWPKGNYAASDSEVIDIQNRKMINWTDELANLTCVSARENLILDDLVMNQKIDGVDHTIKMIAPKTFSEVVAIRPTAGNIFTAGEDEIINGNTYNLAKVSKEAYKPYKGLICSIFYEESTAQSDYHSTIVETFFKTTEPDVVAQRKLWPRGKYVVGDNQIIDIESGVISNWGDELANAACITLR